MVCRPQVAVLAELEASMCCGRRRLLGRVVAGCWRSEGALELLRSELGALGPENGFLCVLKILVLSPAMWLSPTTGISSLGWWEFQEGERVVWESWVSVWGSEEEEGKLCALGALGWVCWSVGDSNCVCRGSGLLSGGWVLFWFNTQVGGRTCRGNGRGWQ